MLYGLIDDLPPESAYWRGRFGGTTATEENIATLVDLHAEEAVVEHRQRVWDPERYKAHAEMDAAAKRDKRRRRGSAEEAPPWWPSPIRFAARPATVHPLADKFDALNEAQKAAAGAAESEQQRRLLFKSDDVEVL